MNLKKAKLNIYTNCLNRISKCGYSNDILKIVTIESGYGEALAEILFPEGIADILTILFEEKYQLALGDAKSSEFNELKVTAKIKFLVLSLLSHLSEDKIAIKSILKNIYKPTLFIKNLKITWVIVSGFWYEAGDKSTDFNFYSKRLILSCVYLPTLIYWLDQNKTDLDTEKFLDNLLGRVSKIGKVKAFLNKGLEPKNIPFLRMFFK